MTRLLTSGFEARLLAKSVPCGILEMKPCRLTMRFKPGIAGDLGAEDGVAVCRAAKMQASPQVAFTLVTGSALPRVLRRSRK